MFKRRIDTCTARAAAEAGWGDEITAILLDSSRSRFRNPPSEAGCRRLSAVMRCHLGVGGPPEISGSYSDGLVEIGVVPRGAGVLYGQDPSRGCAGHGAQQRSAPHSGWPGEHADR